MNLTLIYPMFAVVLLTFVIMTVMFRSRLSAVRSGRLKMSYFKAMTTGETPPDEVVKPSRHFILMFEVPVLFYVGCIVAMIVPIYGIGVQFWAWLFVFARIAQAIVHLNLEKIWFRMGFYAMGWIAILGLWITIMLKVSLLMSGAFAVEATP